MIIKVLNSGGRIVRHIPLLLSALAASSLIAGCSTIYRSPSVTAGVSDAGKVRVVPVTPETVLVANRSPYAPKTLPSVFGLSAGSGSSTSQRGTGPLPEAPST